MDHPAGPCYFWYRSTGVEASGEREKGRRCWVTVRESVSGEENVGGREEPKIKGRHKEIKLIPT